MDHRVPDAIDILQIMTRCRIGTGCPRYVARYDSGVRRYAEATIAPGRLTPQRVPR
jgi:hypothetical protein